MNVSGASSMSSMMMSSMQNQRPPQQSLSEDQKQTVNDILAEYDSSNISQQDFKDIFQKFEDAGITGGESLKNTAEAAGFDFSANIQQAISSGEGLPNAMGTPPGGQGGQGGTPPPPPPQQSSSSSEYSDMLSQLLADYESGDADQTDFEAFIESIKNANFSSTGNIINNKA